MSEESIPSIPVEGQLVVVNSMVLPLLRKTGIDVTVKTTGAGMTLDLRFVEPPSLDADDRAKTVGTDDPDQARMLWALRDKVEEARRAYQSTPAL